MQFISFVMISQLWKDTKEKNLVIPENFKKEFQERIGVLSMGNYTWLIRAIETSCRRKLFHGS